MIARARADFAIGRNDVMRSGHFSNAQSGMIAVLLASAGLCFWGRSAAAGVGVSAKAGTTGLGADLTVSVSSNFNLRAGYYLLSVKAEFEDESDDADRYDVALRLRSIPILLDWHPWKGDFRISAGAVFNGNKLVVSAEEGSIVGIGDGEYLIKSLEGRVTFRDFVPYAGMGYGNAADAQSRWHFAFDFGAIFQGEPDIELKAQAANPSVQNLLDSDVKKEEQDLEDDASVFRIYPVISFGVSFSF